MLTQSQGWCEESRDWRKAMTKKKEKKWNWHVRTYLKVISQMENKTCDVLISIFLISWHNWLSELVFSPPLTGLDPQVFSVTQSTHRVKSSASYSMFPWQPHREVGGSVGGEAHRSPFPNKLAFIVSLCVFSCAKCKHAFNPNQERKETEEEEQDTERVWREGGFIMASLSLLHVLHSLLFSLWELLCPWPLCPQTLYACWLCSRANYI